MKLTPQHDQQGGDPTPRPIPDTPGQPVPEPGPDLPDGPAPDPKPTPEPLPVPGPQPTPEPTPEPEQVPSPLPPEAQRALAEAEERRRRAAALDLPPELGGRDGPEPVRYGDWEKKGIAVDF